MDKKVIDILNDKASKFLFTENQNLGDILSIVCDAYKADKIDKLHKHIQKFEKREL